MSTNQTQPKIKTTPTLADWVFILILICVLTSVGILGHDSYLEAMKTEVTKKNGEELAAWLTQAGLDRFKHQTKLTECMGGKPPVAKLDANPNNITALQEIPVAMVVSEADTPTTGIEMLKVADTTAEESSSADETPEIKPGTWGACFEYLMTKSELKDMLNPFTDEPPQFVPACNPSDSHLPGSIVIEKLTPTPPGSAVPVINSQLVNTDPIDQKMQLRISVCDKGSYAIKIAEFEF